MITSLKNANSMDAGKRIEKNKVRNLKKKKNT